MRLLMLPMITAALLTAATAQTTNTYTIPVGDQCTGTAGLEGCYLNGLIASDGSTGYFAGWQFVYQTPVSKALYCQAGTEVWQTAQMDNGGVFWVMDCNADPAQTSTDGPAKLHLEAATHSSVVTSRCNRWVCKTTVWQVDSGTLAIIE